MRTIADVSGSRGSFLSQLDIVKVNIYVNAMGLPSRILNGTESDEYMYETVKLMVRVNNSGVCVPFAGELDDIINKCDAWKDERDFYVVLEEELGRE